MGRQCPMAWVVLLLALPLARGLGAVTSSLGIDFGTSGVRSCLIDSQSLSVLHECSFGWQSLGEGSSVSSAASWREALIRIMDGVPKNLRGGVRRVCCSGTSSSALLYDCSSGAVTRAPRLYNFNVLSDSPSPAAGKTALAQIAAACPPGSATNAATSTLAKLISWQLEAPLSSSERLLHQADFCAAILTDALSKSPSSKKTTDEQLFPQSDWHNALKLGYDVHNLCYPAWLLAFLDERGISREVLPPVTEPGSAVGSLGCAFVERGFSADCKVSAGTTDSIAAFLAAGATRPGQAVTSLGSTLAVKLLSRKPVADDSRGIYSHRLGDQWLVGGASNVGCAIFRQEGFSDDELRELSSAIDPAALSLATAGGGGGGGGYYPLLKPGERFPVNDPNKQPVLDPRPPAVTRGAFLHGLLLAIAQVEQQGYAALAQLGADAVTEVRTAGGGSKNDVWTAMRAGLLGVPVVRADNADAAFGAARLGLGLGLGSAKSGREGAH